MPASTRTLDVVLYGATGFVGRQTVAYFAQHVGSRLRWGVAGRDGARLRQVLAELKLDVPVWVADAHDAPALAALAAQTRIVLSTAGPYAKFGSALVAACVAERTHYVDITGETPWVHELIGRHHEQARRDSTRIVPCSGYDSCPSDLGAWLVVQAMQQRFAMPVQQLKACHSAKGGVNGGTIASMLGILGGEQERRRLLLDPFLLNPPGTVPADTAAHADPIAPLRDGDFDAWLGPFVMAYINTRVVRRSAALLGYGAGFAYQEYLRLGRGPLAAVAAASLSAGTLASEGLANLAPARFMMSQLARLGPAPGQGPSEAAMEGGRFRCELLGRSAQGQSVRVVVADQGDPGNRATTKFVCEAALALALEEESLPPGGGVLTPASAMGEVLVNRLRRAGMRLDVLP